MATVLRAWGKDVPESRVAELAGTSRLGTSMPQLILAARSLGMDGLEVKRATWEQMQQINRPGILASWLIDGRGRRSPHAIALLGMDDDTALIADPALGKLFALSPEQLQRVWRREYVPLYYPEAATLSPTDVKRYLDGLGYELSLDATQTAALEQFQTDFGVRPTGDLDALTALLLSGDFFEHAPRLSEGLR
jgi:ABC-type bacteriocin/lantibiotic exporter with double-glycine peptidase domain